MPQLLISISGQRAISIGVALIDPIVEGLAERSDRAVAMEYRHHAYDVVNDLLDSISLRLANSLQRQSCRALPIPASKQAVVDSRITAVFSHKLAAHLAGLGWIGKSCLLITPEAGPRVSGYLPAGRLHRSAIPGGRAPRGQI